MFYSIILAWESVSCFTASTIVASRFLFSHRHRLGLKRQMKKNAKMQDICNKETKTTAASFLFSHRHRLGLKRQMKKNAKMQDICNKETKTTAASLFVCKNSIN